VTFGTVRFTLGGGAGAGLFLSAGEEEAIGTDSRTWPGTRVHATARKIHEDRLSLFNIDRSRLFMSRFPLDSMRYGTLLMSVAFVG
jgi:hypothetical protein